MKTKFTVKLILTVKHCLHDSHSKEKGMGENHFALSRTCSIHKPPNGRLYVGLILSLSTTWQSALSRQLQFYLSKKARHWNFKHLSVLHNFHK